MPQIPKPLSRLLAAEQERRRISDAEAARLLGIRTSRYRRISLGEVIPNRRSMNAMSEMLKMDISALMHRRERASLERSVENRIPIDPYGMLDKEETFEQEIRNSIDSLFRSKVTVSPRMYVDEDVDALHAKANEQVRDLGVDHVMYLSGNLNEHTSSLKYIIPPVGCFRIKRDLSTTTKRLNDSEKEIISVVARVPLWFGYSVSLETGLNEIFVAIFKDVPIPKTLKPKYHNSYRCKMFQCKFDSLLGNHYGISPSLLVCPRPKKSMLQSLSPRVDERRKLTADANENEMKLAEFVYSKYYREYPEIKGKEFLDELKVKHGIVMTESEVLRALNKLCNYSYFSKGVVVGSSTRLLFMGSISYSERESGTDTQDKVICGLKYSFSLPRLKDEFPEFDWEDFPSALRQLEDAVGDFYYNASGIGVFRRDEESKRR